MSSSIPKEKMQYYLETSNFVIDNFINDYKQKYEGKPSPSNGCFLYPLDEEPKGVVIYKLNLKKMYYTTSFSLFYIGSDQKYYFGEIEYTLNIISELKWFTWNDGIIAIKEMINALPSDYDDCIDTIKGEMSHDKDGFLLWKPL